MSLFGTGRREGVIAILVLLGLTLLAHLPGLFLGHHRAPLDPEQMSPQTTSPAPAPAVDLSSEAATNQSILLPAMAGAGQTVAGGDLPLWNPRSRFGEPFGLSGAPLLYPPFWILMQQDGYRFLDWVLFLHGFLGCLFMYRFLRALPLHRYVAFLGGGGYGMGWFLTTQMDRLPEAAAAALLPLAMEMSWRISVSRNRALFAGALAGAVGLMFITGGTATATFGTLLCIALFCASLVALDGSNRYKACRTAVISSLLAVLLTSPVWLDAMQHSGDLAEAPPPARHLQLGGFLNAAAPAALTDLRGSTPDALESINPDADPLELVLYPGVLPLFLLTLGLFRPKRTYRGLFWVLTGGTGLLLAMDSPLVDFLYRVTGWAPALPGSSLILTHVAFVVLSSTALESFFDAPASRRYTMPLTAGLVGAFGIAVVALGFVWPASAQGILGWIGADGVQTELAAAVHHLRRQLLVTAGLLGATAGLFLVWRRLGIPRFKTALAVVAFIDLLGVSLLHVPRVDGHPMSENYASHVPDTDGRVMTATRSPLPPGGWLMARGFRTVSTSGHRILRNTAEYLSLVDPSGVVTGAHSRVSPLFVPYLLDHPLLTCAGVMFGVAGESFQITGHRPITSAPPHDPADPGLFVAERRSPLPRARIMFQTMAVSSDVEAAEILRQHPHVLKETLIVQGARQGNEPRRPGVPPTLEIEEDGANRVRITAGMGQGRGYLLLADAMAPGWTATLDGVETPLLQANLAFRAVFVPEGEHTVEFRYSPWQIRFGFPFALIGLALASTWTVLAWRYRRRKLRERRAKPLPAGITSV